MLIKSIFITTFITLLHIAAGYSIFQLYQFGLSWIWLGSLIASLPGTLFFEALLFKPFARTSAHLTTITLLKAVGLMLTILVTINSNQSLYLPLILATVSFAGWIVYDYWYSRFADRSNKILQVGKQLPQLELQTSDGDSFNSDSLIGAPVLYIFYRGNWCPLCMAQIKEVAGEYQQLTSSGVKIALVSPQSHENTQQLAKRFNVPFLFLVDQDNKVAKQLEILAPNGLPLGMQVLGYDSDTVMPTVLITDKNGKIIFADLTDNYRVRPEPQTFIDILNTHTV